MGAWALGAREGGFEFESRTIENASLLLVTWLLVDA